MIVKVVLFLIAYEKSSFIGVWIWTFDFLDIWKNPIFDVFKSYTEIEETPQFQNMFYLLNWDLLIFAIL